MEDEGKDSPEQAALKECAMSIGLFFTYSLQGGAFLVFRSVNRLRFAPPG
jgi:hypothetical protein